MAFPAFVAFRVAKTISGNAPQRNAFTVAAGATFLRGDPVKLSAVNDEITGVLDSGAAILGIAGDDAVPSDGRVTNIGKLITVSEATPDVVYSCAYVSGITADIAIGDKIGLNLTGTVYTVDTSKTDMFITRGLDATDGGQRVLVSVLASASQATGGDVEAA